MPYTMLGVGELVPAHFTVPENTLKPKPLSLGELIAAQFTVPQNTLRRPASMGELTSARFVVPQNTLRPTMLPSGMACLNCGRGGMGALDLSSITNIPSQLLTWFSGQSWVTWAVIGGGLVVAIYYFTSGGSGGAGSYKKELSKAKKKLRDKYPRRGTRFYRAAQAAAEAY